jgi:hypothetical protein
MKKMSTGNGLDDSSSTNTSESGQNQGFLRTFGDEAAQDQTKEGSAKSRKGLKSGEPFSSVNHINLEA